MRRRFSEWKRNKLDDNDRVFHETRVMVDIVYFGLCFDQLNAGSLAVFELACRRIQAVISAYSKVSNMNWSTARLMTVAALVDDGCNRHSGTQHVVHARNVSWTYCEVGRQESRWVQEELRIFLPPPVRRVCAKARHAMWLMRTPSSMKHGGKTMPFTIAASTTVSRLRWLCSLMHTSGSGSAFRTGLPWAPTTQIGLFCAGPVQLHWKNFPSENTTRVRSALQHVTAKAQSCQAVFSRQSRCTEGLEAPRLEIFV